MTPQTDFAAPANQPGDTSRSCIHSIEDQQALAAMLDEDPPASLRDHRIGDTFQHREQQFVVRDRGPYRIAVEGRCARCGFPYIVSGSPGCILRRLTTKCEHCRPGKKGRLRKWAVIEPEHELSRRKHIAGDRNFSPGDFIVRQGHGYLIRRRTEFWNERRGRTLQGFEAIGLCSTCRAPFVITASASQLDRGSLTRRCTIHHATGQRAQPIKWTRKAAREAWGRF